MDQSAQTDLEPRDLNGAVSDRTSGGQGPVRHCAVVVGWPPARSDVVAIGCFALAILMSCLGRSDLLVAFAIACAVASGLSPLARRLVLRAGPEGIQAEIELTHVDGSG